MDARRNSRCVIALIGWTLLGALSAEAQIHRQPGMGQPMVRSENFIVIAATQPLADEVARAAEQQRYDLAVHWLGHPIPKWSHPCPITVLEGARIGAGGSTTFTMSRGSVGDWRMNVQGSHDRILDSVLPHEITHTILASHFAPIGRPVPRWADEGACTTVEHVSEKNKHDHFLVEFLSQGRGIPFATMFSLKDYPADIMPLYAQGYSVSCFLIAQGGPRRFVQFLEDGMRTEDWVAATEKHYGYPKIGKLQSAWNKWVGDGGGTVAQHTAVALGLTRESVAANPNPTVPSQVVLVGGTRDTLDSTVMIPKAVPQSVPVPSQSTTRLNTSSVASANATDSWYKQQLMANSEASNATSVVNPASPEPSSAPSNPDYSTAHPQALESLSRAPAAKWSAGPSVPVYR